MTDLEDIEHFELVLEHVFVGTIELEARQVHFVGRYVERSSAAWPEAFSAVKRFAVWLKNRRIGLHFFGDLSVHEPEEQVFAVGAFENPSGFGFHGLDDFRIGVIVDRNAGERVVGSVFDLDRVAFQLFGIRSGRYERRDFRFLDIENKGMPLEIGHRNHIIGEIERGAGNEEDYDHQWTHDAGKR